MWRSTRKVCFRYSLLSCGQQLKCIPPVQARLQSTGSSSGAGKVAVATAGLAVAGIGGTLAYAKFDPTFRSKVQDSIPYGAAILGTVLGPEEAPKVPKDHQLSPERVKEKALESSLLRKKAVVEPSKDVRMSTVPAPPIPSPPMSPAPPKETAPSPKELEAEAQKQLRDIREKTERLNFALEQSLREAQVNVEKHTKDAVMAQLAANEALQGYIKKLYRALDESRDSEDHFMWEDALQAKEEKASAMKKAAAKTQEAWQSVEDLQAVIKKGQEDKDTRDNLALGPAEHAVTAAKEQLQRAETEVSSAKEAAKIVTDYRELVERGRKHFQQEIEALLPEPKLGDGKKLSEDELNILVAHAHKRVEQLMKSLAKMQVTEIDRAVEFKKQKERVNKELEKKTAELNATLEIKLEKQKENFEEELQHQLRRQVAAHTEHLRECLVSQKEELQREFDRDLEKKLIEERGKHHAALSTSVAKLQGLEGYLKARDELDRVSQQAKGLWLACQALKHTLVYGHTSYEAPQPLGDVVRPVQEAAPMSPYVPLVLASIPEEAIVRGVYPEVALKERFNHVEQVCRRVALIDEQGGSLLRYLASYLQSLFVIYPKVVPEEELTDEQRVNPETWDTFDILSRVRYWLLHENLEQALRYANQLRGEPRLVARDWIREVRLHLETKQAANALMAFAAATIAEDVQ